jgi:hypothetical protein
MARETVLIVEDDNALRGLYRFALSMAGFSLGHGEREVAGAGEDGAWGSLTRLTAARGRRGATVPRLQDRPRSVFEAGGPGIPDTGRSRIGPEPHPSFIEVFS